MIDSFPASACWTLVLFEKYWEIIADNLSKAGWNCGCISSTDHEGRQFWVVAAGRKDGGRFIVHANEKLTAFLELQAATRTLRRIVLTIRRDFCQTRRRYERSESGVG
jgi:hypothetical protein